MIKLDERGHACPLPAINTKKTIEKSKKGDEIQVNVDNVIAVQNLEKLAKQKGCDFSYEKIDNTNYEVHIKVNQDGTAAGAADEEPLVITNCAPGPKKTVVVISSSTMGTGDDDLGKLLMKSFIFACTQLDKLPDQMLFYNGGAFLTCEGSESLENLKNLAEAGVKISTCGTCLNHYGLGEKLAVGDVANMYDIVSLQAEADLIIRP